MQHGKIIVNHCGSRQQCLRAPQRYFRAHWLSHYEQPLSHRIVEPAGLLIRSRSGTKHHSMLNAGRAEMATPATEVIHTQLWFSLPADELLALWVIGKLIARRRAA